jgi:hypothetical protein
LLLNSSCRRNALTPDEQTLLAVTAAGCLIAVVAGQGRAFPHHGSDVRVVFRIAVSARYVSGRVIVKHKLSAGVIESWLV